MSKSKKDKYLEKLSNVGTFSALSRKELFELSKLMTQINVVSGRALTRQGARGSDFMFVTEGKAVVKRNNRKVADLGPGDFMGELSILSGSPQNATVEAKTDMVIQVLNRREFMILLDKSPSMAKKILIGAVKRLQSLDKSKTN